MTNSTDQSQTRELVFFNSSGSSLQLQAVNLDLIKQDDTLSECRLAFQVTSDLYQQIDTESLFNLKPQLRGALNAASFQSEAKVEIEATLQPQLLPQLAEQATDAEAAIAYLIACSQEISNALLKESEADPTNESTKTHPCPNPLLSTESWFALNVKQHQETGEVGYRTFWSYLNPASLTPEAIANGQFSEAMEQFLKDRNEANLAIAGKALSDALEEISKDLKNWDETEFVKQTESVISNFFSEVTDAFENWVEPKQPSGRPKNNSKGRIYQAMLNFFSEEDWEFTKLQGELTLRLACQGKNGQWNCFALANESPQQFLFYSICPLDAPSVSRSAIAELLTRANYGMAIGNFELDFTSGEIRFKTSLDIIDDRLPLTLIKRLVYTNVTMMDEYLPGIRAILENNVAPSDAIAAIEQADSNAPLNPSDE